MNYRQLNIDLYKKLPASREEMITRNMGLVKLKVKRFLKAFPRYKYLSKDLLSAGYVGLVEAVNKLCEPGSNNENPTGLISFKVLTQIGTCIDDEKLIRVPDRSKRRGAREPKIVPLVQSELLREDEHTLPLKDEILGCCESPEEVQIVKLRAQGHKDESIAQLLGTTRFTITVLRNEIYDRFKARNPEMNDD